MVEVGQAVAVEERGRGGRAEEEVEVVGEEEVEVEAEEELEVKVHWRQQLVRK